MQQNMLVHTGGVRSLLDMKHQGASLHNVLGFSPSVPPATGEQRAHLRTGPRQPQVGGAVAQVAAGSRGFRASRRRARQQHPLPHERHL